MEAPPNRRPPPEDVAELREAVEQKHDENDQACRRPNTEQTRQFSLVMLRLRQLQKVFRFQYGPTLPDDDAGRDSAAILVNYAAMCPRLDPRDQLDVWAPWMTGTEREDMLASSQRSRPVWHIADDLAKRIGLTYQHRQMLNITCIGACDVDQDERERLRCDRRNAGKRASREQTEKEDGPMLTTKQRKVLGCIDGNERPVPELVKQLNRVKEFRRLASPRQEVHRILDHLVSEGLAVERYELGPRGTPIRYVRANGTSNDRAQRAELPTTAGLYLI
jgi:hypothetical protein